MVRPRKRRLIKFNPNTIYFKPRAIPLNLLKEVDLNMDEIESIRLCDFKGIEQIEAAKKMKISQSTLQRILTSARQKISEALVLGKAIRINKKNEGK